MIPTRRGRIPRPVRNPPSPQGVALARAAGSRTWKKVPMHLRLRSTLVLLLVSAFAAPLGAVPGGAGDDRVAAIHGVVLDASSGQPVAGATVRLRELRRSELSHADGSFHFERLAAGTYTVTVNRVGYALAERSVEVPATGTVEVRSASSRRPSSSPRSSSRGREPSAPPRRRTARPPCWPTRNCAAS
jgi:hypothetical protein